MRLRLRPTAIALACILALALVAASLTSPLVTGGGGGESVLVEEDAEPADGEAADGESFAIPANLDGGNEVRCDDDTTQWVFRLLAIGVGLLVVAVALSMVVEEPRILGLAVVALAPLPPVLFLLLVGCGLDSFVDRNGDETTTTAGDGGGTNGDAVTEVGDGFAVSTPRLALGVLVVLLVLAVLVGGARSRRGDGTLSRFDAPAGSGQERAIRRIAGRTADEVESDAGLENAVYRAWAEMVSELEADDPETSTTGEFARHAHDAGIAGADVDELTRLFEEVRYGGVDVTDERERRAVEVLRRIERGKGEARGKGERRGEDEERTPREDER